MDGENSMSAQKHRLKTIKDITHKDDTYWIVILNVVELHGTVVT